MNENIDSLSLFSQIKPINQDITVIYTPNIDAVSYNYTLYKDNQIIETHSDNANIKSIIMTETGEYKLIINETDNLGNINQIESGYYRIDKEKPVINVGNQVLNMQIGDTLDLYSDIEILDNVDGNITDKVATNYNELNFDTVGTKQLVYTVSDEAGNIATKIVNINVTSSFNDTLIYIQIGLIIILLAFTYLIFSFRKSVKLEKRISKFSIRPLEDNSLSIFDNITKNYQKLISKISNSLEKSAFIQKYSKRFNKYLSLSNKIYTTSIDFVSSKVVVAFIFVLIAVFSKALKSEVINSYEIIIPLIAGFFLLDIVYFSKYRLYRNKIENDLLQAIIVMNNAFKSGRSITQAIALVMNEIHGPIGEEFRKMHMEISLGLSLDVVFKRFSNRIQLEEVAYLTSSLTILNKTGGNIIKVFSSIEKTLIDKRKLKLELASLTSSSKMITKILFVVPLVFALFINTLNPSYFLPFFTTDIGLILLFFIILIYILYIIFVRKLMKVRM